MTSAKPTPSQAETIKRLKRENAKLTAEVKKLKRKKRPAREKWVNSVPFW